MRLFIKWLLRVNVDNQATWLLPILQTEFNIASHLVESHSPSESIRAHSLFICGSRPEKRMRSTDEPSNHLQVRRQCSQSFGSSQLQPRAIQKPIHRSGDQPGQELNQNKNGNNALYDCMRHELSHNCSRSWLQISSQKRTYVKTDYTNVPQ